MVNLTRELWNGVSLLLRQRKNISALSLPFLYYISFHLVSSTFHGIKLATDKVKRIHRVIFFTFTKFYVFILILKAKIYEQVYDGAFTKILMHVDGNIVKSIISGNDKLYNRGDEVYIYWDIEDAIVLGDKNGK